MGRKTYNPAVEHSSGNPYKGVKTYVFSRTLEESKNEDVEIIRADAAEFVRNLRSEDGKNICVMGGGELAQSLFEAELIDEVSLNIHPVLLGSGIPLFHEMKHQVDLELVECRTLDKGCILSTYRVRHRSD